MANNAPSAVGGRQLTMARELGARRVQTHAAHWGSGTSSELVVVQKWRTDEDEAASLHALDASQSLARLRHPNVARVREAVRRDGTILLVSDWIDGATLGDLVAASNEKSEPIPLAIVMRVLLDALAGLSAIHGVRDKTGKALGVFHGALSPEQLVVGVDGNTRVLSPSPGAPTIETGGATNVRFAAPELLLGDETADARVDVYAVGVMLWEALAQKKLFEETTAGAILTRHLAGKVEAAPARKDPSWAEPLGAVAQHAIATDPGSRFASANELANELKKHAGAHAAKTADVSSWVEKIAGGAISARREKLSPPGAKKEIPRGSLPYARKPLTGAAAAPVQAAAKIEPPKTEPAAIEATKIEATRSAAPQIETSKVEAAHAALPHAHAPQPGATKPETTKAAASPEPQKLPALEAPPPIKATAMRLAPPPVAAPAVVETPLFAAAPPSPPDPPPSFQEISDDEVEIAPPSAPPRDKVVMAPLPRIPPLTAPPSVAEVVDRAAATTPANLPLPMTDAQRRRRRAIVLVPLALALLLLLVVGIRSAFRGGDNGKNDEAQTHTPPAKATQTAAVAGTNEAPTVAATTIATDTAAPTTATTAVIATTATTQPSVAVVAAPTETTTAAETSKPPTTAPPTKSPPRPKPTYDPLGI